MLKEHTFLEGLKPNYVELLSECASNANFPSVTSGAQSKFARTPTPMSKGTATDIIWELFYRGLFTEDDFVLTNKEKEALSAFFQKQDNLHERATVAFIIGTTAPENGTGTQPGWPSLVREFMFDLLGTMTYAQRLRINMTTECLERLLIDKNVTELTDSEKGFYAWVASRSGLEHKRSEFTASMLPREQAIFTKIIKGPSAHQYECH